MKLPVALLTLLISGTVAADGLAPAARAEIAHLFAHLEQSGCQFNRNGNWYNATEAVAHLNKKYEYLQKKGLVSSTEAFIERAATESSMSGTPYLVKCGTAAPQPSAAWFRAALQQFRKARP